MLLQYLDALVGQLCIFMGAHLDIASMFFVGNLLTVDEMGEFMNLYGSVDTFAKERTPLAMSC